MNKGNVVTHDQQNTPSLVNIDSIKGQVFISPKSKNRLIKLIGDKCIVKLGMEDQIHEVLWDTGAQVSLVDEE